MGLGPEGVSPRDWVAHVQGMAALQDVARRNYILVLKHSGERIGDLRSLPVEELAEWARGVRDANEREARRQREAIEKMRKQGRRR